MTQGHDAVEFSRKYIEVSERGRVVLALLGRGLTNKELAHALGISVSTAKWHVSRLLELFDAPNRAALVQKAISARVLEVGPP